MGSVVFMDRISLQVYFCTGDALSPEKFLHSLDSLIDDVKKYLELLEEIAAKLNNKAMILK